MNYLHIYNQIIERGKRRVLNEYKERHHIIPKCMNGDDSPENIVELTAKEHFICHKLLVEIYPKENGLKYALWMMSTMNDVYGREYRVSSREYNRIKESLCVSDTTRQKISNTLTGIVRTKEHNKNSSLSRMGKRKSKETRRKMSIAKKNMSDETKKKMSIAKQNMSDETKKKMSESFTGRVYSSEMRKKLKKYRTGKTHTPETIEKMKTLGKKRCSEKIICPHCGKEGAKPIMKRWHFDNCKDGEK